MASLLLEGNEVCGGFAGWNFSTTEGRGKVSLSHGANVSARILGWRPGGVKKTVSAWAEMDRNMICCLWLGYAPISPQTVCIDVAWPKGGEEPSSKAGLKHAGVADGGCSAI